jgi:ribosome-associated protein
VKSTAESVAFRAKQAGQPPIGIEGLQEGEWALIDLNGVVVHIMQPKVRDFYQLERLWSVDPEAAEKVSKERGVS